MLLLFLQRVAQCVHDPGLLGEQQSQGKQQRKKGTGKFHARNFNKGWKTPQGVVMPVACAVRTTDFWNRAHSARYAGYSLCNWSAWVKVQVRVILRMSVSLRMSGGSGA